MNIEGKVTKGVGGVFTIRIGNDTLICHAPKKLRYVNSDIMVGDNVTVTEFQHGKGIIERVLPRKNRLIRPQVANVDTVCIVTSQLPPTDFMLIDKVLINCAAQAIDAIILINKCEISEPSYEQNIKNNYGAVASVISVSAHKGNGMPVLIAELRGTVCFAGQSGVGKTSIINVLLPAYSGITGDISKKINRGKNTTRHTELLPIADGAYLCDTPGFSLIELTDMPSASLRNYYPDFCRYTCRFATCTHTAEPDCGVKRAVESGKIQSERYSRYLDIFAELREQEKNKY